MSTSRSLSEVREMCETINLPSAVALYAGLVPPPNTHNEVLNFHFGVRASDGTLLAWESGEYPDYNYYMWTNDPQLDQGYGNSGDPAVYVWAWDAVFRKWLPLWAFDDPMSRQVYLSSDLPMRIQNGNEHEGDVVHSTYMKYVKVRSIGTDRGLWHTFNPPTDE